MLDDVRPAQQDVCVCASCATIDFAQHAATGGGASCASIVLCHRIQLVATSVSLVETTTSRGQYLYVIAREWPIRLEPSEWMVHLIGPIYD